MKFSPISIAMFRMMTMLSGMPATAQNMSFGADNFYHSESVTVQPVAFQNQYQMTIAGNLFIRENLTSNTKAPAIVISHPMGAVKEQSANLYAIKLAEQGFVTPRNAVSPDIYAEAFSAAVDYLGTQSFVDRERIGGLGTCGSGSFVISAAKIDPRIKVIATSSMYDMGASNRNGLQHSQNITQRKEIIAQAARQRWKETEGGEIQYTSGAPQNITQKTDAVGREFYDYYRTRRAEFTPEGSSPNLTTHPTLTSNVKFMNFYPFNDIDTISPRPMLFISGDQAHSREFSEDAYTRADEPKELYWDRVDLIPFDKLTQFFNANLAQNATSVARGGARRHAG
ncbi:Alpha/Beta hydrolase protein [Aspergillus keveii]|uniref:Alpha/Beta hydrolase protein n=1 Tax=Aspergillus keveii TaxID=714993 RepID=A0ABR4FKP5_9EURO